MRARVSGRRCGGVFAEHFGPAVAGMGHAQQHLDGGRLARPVAAQQPVDRSLGHPQVEPIDRAVAVVILRQAMGDNHVGHGWMVPPRSGTLLASGILADHWNCFTLLRHHRDDLVGREAQVHGLGQKAVQRLLEPLLADLPRQFAARAGRRKRPARAACSKPPPAPTRYTPGRPCSD